MSLPLCNRRIGIVLLAILFYVCALIATWNLSTQHAKNQTEGMLDYSMMDVKDTVNGSIDTMLMHIAESIVEELETAKPLSHEDALRIISQRDIDEVNVLDSKGRNLGSSDARIVGTHGD